MLIRHEEGNLICNVQNEVYYGLLDNGIKTINMCESLYEALIDYCEDLIDDDELEEIFEDNGDLPLYGIKRFYESLASVEPMLNKYAKLIFEQTSVLQRNLNKINETCCYLSQEDRELFKKQIYRTLSGNAYLIFHEFCMQRAIDSDLAEVDEFLFNYTSKHNYNLKQFINRFVKLNEEYKMRLEVFDANPELEEEFEKVMGYYMTGIENEEDLTIDLVKDVIDGKLSPEELLIKLYGEQDALEYESQNVGDGFSNTEMATGFNK